MTELISVFYIVFGALTLCGGAMGYARKRSVASLVSGVALGALLVFASAAVGPRLHIGLLAGLIASAAVAGKFIPDFLVKRTLFPAGIMAALGAAGLVLTIYVWTNR